MSKVFSLLVLLALSGCANLGPSMGLKPFTPEKSACDVNETSYDCQIERYNNVSGPA